MSITGRSVVIVSTGYEGKRPALTRMAKLGARLVIVEEPGHWSECLVAEGIAASWIPVEFVGDPDQDATATLDALTTAGIEADGVLTHWEDSICVAARVAHALGLPGNPPEAVDTARSKVRTREVSSQLGLPTPRAQRVRSLDELYAAAVEIGFPAVVKPEFGAMAMGCVRVDEIESLPDVYSLVRSVVVPETDTIFRAGNDLLLEEYLDGVEFDVDLVMEQGECVFSSVSQNSPTAEPSFQETGLHLPPDHDRRAVRRLVDLAVQTVQAFGLGTGVLHVEGKCTTRGPRIVEVNARLAGGRIWQMVEAVWGVDLVEAHLRASLGLPAVVHAARRPRCAVVDRLVYAPSTGRLTSFPIGDIAAADCLGLDIDVQVGADVSGPDQVFSTFLGEVVVTAKNLKRARAIADGALRQPPVVAHA